MSEYTDKTLTCVECSAEFPFTAGEQGRFAELGFTNEPKRCGPCRIARKARGGQGGGQNRTDSRGPSSGPKEMHSATCAECGTSCQVPFKPRGDRPVYCSTCFNNQKR